MPRKKQHRKLPNGVGSISKLSGNRENKFLARKKGIRLPDGSMYREVVGTYKTWEDAYQVLISNDKKVDKKITIYELFELFTQSIHFKSLSKSAQSKYIWGIKKWDMLIYKPVYDVQFHELQAQLDKIQLEGYTKKNGDIKFYSDSSIKKIYNALIAAYNEAIKARIFETNIVELLRIDSSLISVNDSQKYFDLDFVVELLNKPNKSKKEKILLVNIFTGLRPTEMMKLEKSHVNFEKGYIHGMGIKSNAGKQKFIVILDLIKPYLLDLYNDTEKYILGKKYSYTVFLTEFDALVKSLGYTKYVTPYACRHTYAMLMDNFSVDKDVIKKMMGHSSYKTTTQNYIDFNLEKAVREMRKIDLK